MSLTRVSRKARTSRTISLLVTCSLLAITIIQLPKAADLMHELQSQKEQQAGLLSGELAPQRSVELDEKLEELRSEVSRYEKSMLGIEQMPKIQSELMELAMNSNCKLRKSVGQSGNTKPWVAANHADNVNAFGENESPYQLSVEQLSLLLEGSLDESFDFLRKLRERQWLMKCTSVTFSRSPEDSGRLSIEVSLSFYKLTKSKTVEEPELIEWREGSRAESVL